MSKIILNVEGMHCAACSAAVERALSKIDGVENASVNLTANNALINFDESKTTVEAMITAINNAGFSGSLPQAKEKEETLKKDIKKSKRAALKLIFSVLFGTPLFYVAMGHMLGLPLPEAVSPSANPFGNALCQLLLCIPVLLSGFDIFKNAVKSAFHKNVNMDTLVFMGSFASFAYSLFSLSKIVGGANEYVHQLYFDSAGMIITFILIGRYLESSSKKKTNAAVDKLFDLSPKTALLIVNGNEKEVSSDSLRAGDIVAVKSGMSIPVDGTVIEGICTVNESMLTGESLPVEKSSGSHVYGGTVNNNGYIRFRVDASLSESAPAKIAEYINEAQSTKAPIALLANKIASVFVPAVMLIALIASGLWLLSGESFTFALKIFVCVLVIACPCSLGLATPTAITVSMGAGASKGILIKNGEALQRLEKIDTVVFDKTGTITKGKPQVKEFTVFEGFESKDVINKFYAAEIKSEHPLAKAIIEYCEISATEKINCSEFKTLTGLGIECVINGTNVVCGSYKLMKQISAETESGNAFFEKTSSSGKTAIFMSINGKLAAAASIADSVRENCREIISEIKNLGIETAIITGDNEKTALGIASEVGIDKVYADLMPEEKLSIVSKLRSEGKIVAMVGDGINDAPSLTAADVGIAIGSGTDIAIDCADIVLIRSDLTGIPAALKLSRSTMKIIKQNLFWAFAYNCICIPVAAGILHIFGGPLLNPMIAAAAMSLSSVTVVSNSLRLRKEKNK